jgi:ABC-type phosphate transport system substrate-binding protein
MKFRELSKEFRSELFNAIRLSAFLTAVVFGFFFFQNRVANQAEIEEYAGQSPEATKRCTIDGSGNRMPASEKTAANDRVDCR